MLHRTIASLAVITAGACALAAFTFSYPSTRRTNDTETFHGIKVADPYRWLDDDTSPEVRDWVKAENKVTFDYFEKIPYRAQLKERLTRLVNYPKFSPPVRRGEMVFFAKNDGLQNQAVWYKQGGQDASPEL